MTYRLRNILVAAGLAVVAALLTTFYVANYKRHVRQAEATVKVYVELAARLIVLGPMVELTWPTAQTRPPVLPEPMFDTSPGLTLNTAGATRTSSSSTAG